MSEPVEMVWEDCSQGTTPRPFETKQVRALWAFFGFDVQAFDRWLASVKADVWDERDNATPQFLGPDIGHYDDECGGWEDCHCESYPNPYRGAEA
jgi:hypothetical protein